MRIKEISLFHDHKLSRIRAFQIFKVINYRENGQNSRKPRKFLLAKVSAPKVASILELLKILPEVIVASTCGLLARTEKQAVS